MARNLMRKNSSLADALFNREKVKYLAQLFKDADASFDTHGFTKKILSKLTSLPLKERIVWIAVVLEAYLPKDFEKAHKIILRALPKPLDPHNTDDDFGDFIFAPLGEYVVRNSNTPKHVQSALRTLEALTQRFSMEDAMRYFLQEHQKATIKQYAQWVKHPHYHVRRLVSESTRPFLPWSRRIALDVQVPIVFLDQLHTDSTRFVTRSVANHLNDISKLNPELVIATLKRWYAEKPANVQELDWIVRHALRTLVKEGNVEALQLLGYTSAPKILVKELAVDAASKIITRDGLLSFSFTIEAREDAMLMIDYVIDFVKANGKSKPKVFKLKKMEIKKGECARLVKKQRFSTDATTYTLYPGIHRVTLQINGVRYDSASFTIR